IGGLCAAIGLRRAGFEVRVYERAEVIQPLGAGLTLQPNALLALRRMGIGEAIEAEGAPLRAGAVLRWDGSPLMNVPEAAVAELVRELGAGILGIHRATLHAALLRELGGDVVQLGRAATGFSVMGERVRLHFEGAADAVCDALIGADGLHSVVRGQLHGAGAPVYAGYTSFRGVTHDRCGLPADFGGELWGRGRRFGGCCIDGGRFYWFATLDAPQGERHASPVEQRPRCSRCSPISAPRFPR
ncbi:MAG TPA: FAD-dependent monooxygenase, partial [Polyangiales bacterium]